MRDYLRRPMVLAMTGRFGLGQPVVRISGLLILLSPAIKERLPMAKSSGVAATSCLAQKQGTL